MDDQPKLRDFFAAQIAGAMVSRAGGTNDTLKSKARVIAQSAYEIADAMLAERAKAPPPA